MTHPDPDSAPAVGAADGIDWEARYASAEQIWSGRPNGALVAEMAAVAPGTAVDVGCGEGADAIWLAEQGWRVVAFDVSSIALGRAADHVATAGVSVELVHRGLAEVALEDGPFDLVNVQYPALAKRHGSFVALCELVAPGGTLLFVHHADMGSHAARAGMDPEDYLLPHDVHDALDEEWDVMVYEQRPRHVTTGAGARHAADVVLRARRKRHETLRRSIDG